MLPWLWVLFAPLLFAAGVGRGSTGGRGVLAQQCPCESLLAGQPGGTCCRAPSSTGCWHGPVLQSGILCQWEGGHVPVQCGSGTWH